MSEKIEKYDLKWDSGLHPVEIEMKMIRLGGRFPFGKSQAMRGNGLVFHYEQMRKLIWPELDSHRWHELCLNEIRRPNAKVTAIFGPASSGKTHEAACNYLMEYYCFPNETCVLVSSTDLRGLELRVWGEIKSLHERARDKFDFIPGILIDSKHAIASDDIEEDQVRDLRRGLIAIPTVQGGKNVGLGKWCFVSGTLVDTPSGKKPIESIQSGDLVYCCSGVEPVINTISSHADSLVRVSLNSGEQIICTPEHPFLTISGWVNAIDLLPQSDLISRHETLSILSGRDAELETPILQQEMSDGVMEKRLQAVQEVVCPKRAESDFLFSILRGEMDDFPARYNEANDSWKRPEESWRSNQQGHQKEQERDGKAEGFCKEASSRRNIQTGLEQLQYRHGNNLRACAIESISGGGSQSSGKHRKISKAGEVSLLQNGFGVAGYKTRGGSGRKIPPIRTSAHERQEQGFAAFRKRVVGVEVLKPEDCEKYRDGERGYLVHNLEVAGHPSYSVCESIVHNCGIKQKRLRLVADECQLMGVSFLNAFANLDKNEDFQAIVLGNPIDFNDPLGKAAEPKDGWTGHLEPKKTECWDTRFMNGRAVNLVGTDSPNFDYPESEPTRFKYLISREKIANTLSFFPENSLEYYSQCIGVMKVAGMERRVLTRDIIRQYEADKDTAFQGEAIKVYFVDASRGGDKCVGGHGEFGINVEGKKVLRLGEPKVIPIIVGSGTDPEYQIANFVKQDCTILGVPPSNMGHDATGWGSLGTALAVVWSNQTIPVESGGSPTQRPVSNDLFIMDDSVNPPMKRLKLCHEHYEKRVTEFWFSMRYSVESGQIKNLPEEAIEDLVERKWDYNRGNKIGVEAKSSRVMADGSRRVGMKERIGRSPDYGDWACGILEMARRRGFVIERLGRNIDNKKTDNHLQKLHQEHQSLLAGRQLVNA